MVGPATDIHQNNNDCRTMNCACPPAVVFPSWCYVFWSVDQPFNSFFFIFSASSFASMRSNCLLLTIISFLPFLTLPRRDSPIPSYSRFLTWPPMSRLSFSFTHPPFFLLCPSIFSGLDDQILSSPSLSKLTQIKKHQSTNEKITLSVCLPWVHIWETQRKSAFRLKNPGRQKISLWLANQFRTCAQDTSYHSPYLFARFPLVVCCCCSFGPGKWDIYLEEQGKTDHLTSWVL